MYHPDFSTMCSAELLSHKVLVPCDPVGYLNKNYGSFKKWSVPEAEFKKYKWPNINYTGTWSDEQYRKSVRIFESDGSVDQLETLNFWNEALDKKIPVEDFKKFSESLFTS